MTILFSKLSYWTYSIVLGLASFQSSADDQVKHPSSEISNKKKTNFFQLEAERSELEKKQNELDEQISRLEALKVERNRVEEELKKKVINISTLKKLTEKLEINGFETPKKKTAVLMISSDEEKNAPIWEMPGYNNK